MGAVSLPNLGSLEWRWIVALALAAFLVWRLMARPSRAERRRRLALARAKYQLEAAKI